MQRSVGALAHLARHPERGGAVTEAVVDARLRDVRHGWVCGGLGECAGGVWRRAVVCQSARRPLRLSAAESARLSVCLCQSAVAGEAALLLGGWARVVGTLTSCVMSLTILRASRRTAPSFPFSHASYSFSARESDLLADSIVRAASRCGGGTALWDAL